MSQAGRRPLLLLGEVVMVGGGSLALAAASSGGSSSASSSGAADAAAKVPTSLCQQIGGVLSGGPDPVGAALSQILPLQGIHSSDTSVIHTVSKLVSADQVFYHSNGTDKTAATSIEKTEASLNQACPGVAS